MVGHDVPQGESSTLVVLGNLEDGFDVGALECDGLGVPSPNGGFDHVGFVHRNVEGVDDGLGGRGGGDGESGCVLDTGVHPVLGDDDDQVLSARFHFDDSVVSVVDLNCVLDDLGDLVRVLDERDVDLLSLDDNSASGHGAGLEGFLDAGQVDGDGPLCQGHDLLDRVVAQRTDGFERNVFSDAFAAVVIQVNYVLVFWHFIPPCSFCRPFRTGHPLAVGITCFLNIKQWEKRCQIEEKRYKSGLRRTRVLPDSGAPLLVILFKSGDEPAPSHNKDTAMVL